MSTITIDRVVIQQALSALEKAHHAMQADMAQEVIEDAIDALRAALAEPQDPVVNQQMTTEPMIDGYPLWSGMPQRQPLSLDAIHAIARKHDLTDDDAPDWLVQVIRAIETAHGIGGQDGQG